MECQILMSKIAGLPPLSELGGLCLGKGEKLLVNQATAKELKKNYEKVFMDLGTIPKERLTHGNYEIVQDKAAVETSLVTAPQPMAFVASDRSMQAKTTKTRRK